ncbi:hypothetical protein [Pleurocapsa sp. PCC 7319]|uniref:hypothetical protein n=1 Tax=Pleurocapsa sp. PCC 7319 TaxID=118161 RepID=UPI00034BF1CB|nr:hypothetical protein [Pleurocapsa sp. PCC 7319]
MEHKSKTIVPEKMAIFSPALSEDELAERTQYLKFQQQEYEFTHEYVEGLSLFKEVPVIEE